MGANEDYEKEMLQATKQTRSYMRFIVWLILIPILVLAAAAIASMAVGQ